ncbi:hypothetical protein FHR90_002835 [Endobacter medicaginis]|uniref:Phage tail protein n=1 Tax=Endobacter medicaginis TaxID=1181271 RepID=A0A850NK34_9PROT|nr:hypothetical protein [Endobacter medicaginis]MBB3174988.1 hypothetical protein [Endobacter medicaginis]MCX5475911.1 hypothetical protein [Endobacter medicaginis]NVN28839.1 hypothetical protein [Endobacter medicaginis]
MDLSHDIGGDLMLDAGSGLATVTADDWVRQRVLRRLLTNPGDYIWDVGYGGGLRSQIGNVVAAGQIAASIRRQLQLEAAIATSPAPQVSVSDSGNGTIDTTITYADAADGTTSRVALTVGGSP